MSWKLSENCFYAFQFFEVNCMIQFVLLVCRKLGLLSSFRESFSRLEIIAVSKKYNELEKVRKSTLLGSTYPPRKGLLPANQGLAWNLGIVFVLFSRSGSLPSLARLGGRLLGSPQIHRLKGVHVTMSISTQPWCCHTHLQCVRHGSYSVFQRFFVCKTGNIWNLSWELLATNLEGFFIRQKKVDRDHDNGSW